MRDLKPFFWEMFEERFLHDDGEYTDEFGKLMTKKKSFITDRRIIERKIKQNSRYFPIGETYIKKSIDYIDDLDELREKYRKIYKDKKLPRGYTDLEEFLQDAFPYEMVIMRPPM